MFIKFTGMQHLKQISLCDCDEDFLAQIYHHLNASNKDDYSSLGLTQSQDAITVQLLKNMACPAMNIDAVKNFYQILPLPFKQKYFRDHEMSYLNEMYSIIYPSTRIVNVFRNFREYNKCIVNNEEFISKRSLSQRSCAVAAKWSGVNGIDATGDAPLRIGKILSFVQRKVTIGVEYASDEPSTSTTTNCHVLALVKWDGDHPRQSYCTLFIICSSVFEAESCASFIPISRISSRCDISSSQEFSFDFGLDRVIFAVPLIKNGINLY